jgi:O-antigen biosynthesis protein
MRATNLLRLKTALRRCQGVYVRIGSRFAAACAPLLSSHAVQAARRKASRSTNNSLSAEERFRIVIVSHLYRMLLGRTADVAGLLAAVKLLREGIPFDTIMTEALRSEEFMNRRGAPVRSAADLDALFLAAYGRPPPDLDRTLAPGPYAARLAIEAERQAPSRISDILHAEGLNPMDEEGYQLWLEDHYVPDEEALRTEAADLPGEIVVSLVLLGGRTPSTGLTATLESFHRQICDRFDVVAVGSRRFCNAVTQNAPRATVVVSRPTTLAAGLNAALPQCRGRFILMLRPGMRLAADALCHIAKAARHDRTAAALLLDHDRVDARGLRFAPTFHAGWDPDVALCRIDWSPGLLLRTELAAKVGGARAMAGAAAYLDLAFRVIEASGHERVHHIPRPLVMIPTARFSLAKLPSKLAERARQSAWERQVKRHLGGGDDAPRIVKVDGLAQRRVAYSCPQQPPTVSVIVPTRDKLDLLRPCLDGLLNRTRYQAVDIVVIDNCSAAPDTLSYLQEIVRQPRVRVLRYDAAFNWGAINNFGVRQTEGEIVLLLNNDTEVLEPDWLDELVAQALRPEVGTVGPKLLYRDLTVQHAALTLGPDGHAFHRFRYEPGTIPGYQDELMMVRNVSAVTGACLAMRRSVFEEVGGIEEQSLAVTWGDVDLCYRVRAAGYRVLWTPFARMQHLELATRGKDDTPERVARAEREREYMMKKWPSLATEDPHFNPNFRLAEGETRLASPPRFANPVRGDF